MNGPIIKCRACDSFAYLPMKVVVRDLCKRCAALNVEKVKDLPVAEHSGFEDEEHNESR